MLKCCYVQYFECIFPKTCYSCFLCLRNRKVINVQIFPTLVQEKCWSQQKLWYLAKNVVAFWCRTVWSIFVHNLVTTEQKIKKWWSPTLVWLKVCHGYLCQMLFGDQSRPCQSLNHHQNHVKFCHSKKKDMCLLSGFS